MQHVEYMSNHLSKLVYVYHFFNVKRHVSEILTGLIWCTCFEMALAWTKNEVKVNAPILKFINIVLCSSELIFHHHCKNETKTGKTGAHERYFFFKNNNAHIEYFSQKTHCACKLLPCYTNRRPCLGLIWQ